MKADFEKGTKVCSKCRKELPISEFYKNKGKKDGLQGQCKNCIIEYYNKHNNTFGRTGRKRGCSGMLKRDYELTEEQLRRRNNYRYIRNIKKEKINSYGILVWYSGLLDDLSSKEYEKVMHKEYNRQRSCAIRGYIGRVKPSEHFLFDFDLEQMLKGNIYYSDGTSRKYIYKWWKGEIRHWTVNDGVWKDGK